MKKNIIREWQIFLLAMSIFSRIPISAAVPYSEARKNESYKYCGLVGLVVGSLNALVFLTANLIWPVDVSIALSMAFSVYLTGAFHEDGFADTCDGFGGAFTAEKKLEIMKDSRVGAYALLGVVLILLLKYTTLIGLDNVALLLVISHILSRTMAVSFVYTHGYVRQVEQSKLNIARSPNSQTDFITLLVIGGLTLFFVPTLQQAIMLVIVLLVMRWVFSRWMIKQIGGYTGDTLGAIQQVTEVICYLFFLAYV
ncbi:adenosylcobinamide-GDP ribazoletransferase [Vibrio sp. TH_r3]|uniref:adenosylcobinamide-GDP ribazoletransferase n=1 Tax=Vibrio sp. TH_r3 TaxID=3082084 RepID=UPI002952A39C|nr:adenosylcobinamide-GDP ribazoletransferase [Vibrio sp. TH_r3]MDV7103713.1 adenosylcobinamide-GDP ribazoletransferase [Vibrio sp. TH_r3]